MLSKEKVFKLAFGVGQVARHQLRSSANFKHKDSLVVELAKPTDQTRIIDECPWLMRAILSLSLAHRKCIRLRYHRAHGQSAWARPHGLRKQLRDDISAYVRQTKVSSLVTVSQLFVVQT